MSRSHPFSIVSGGDHTCAIVSDGGQPTVQCWGVNLYGQLGAGDVLPRTEPVTVDLGGATPVSLGAGRDMSCVVLSTGSARCWGSGYLGDGNQHASASAPVTVSGLSDLVAVAVGDTQACVLRQDGSVWCWGSGGLLGTGDNDDSLVPVPVGGALSDVTAIASGDTHTCALNGDSTVWCWGSGDFGVLGNGDDEDALEPVQVSGLSDVVAIAAGGDLSCAVDGSGGVHCWGRSNGGLGDGSTTQSDVPVTSTEVTDALDVAAFGSNTCAVRADSRAWCWGDNEDGQLGPDGVIDEDPVAEPVRFRDVATNQVSVGSDYICILDTTGDLYCSGDNEYGQAAGPLTDAVAEPLSVASNASTVVVGERHACVLTLGGELECWGSNSQGQLGDGTRDPSSEPVSPVGLGTVWAPSAGADHTCAVKSDGVWCWGSNFAGQLGDSATPSGSNQRSLTPVAVDAPVTGGAAMVAAAFDHTCAVESYEVLCWGSNSQGQLGIDIVAPSGSDVPVEAGDFGGDDGNAARVAVGSQHTCALLTSGEVRCWGSQAQGRLGNGVTAWVNSSDPQVVETSAGVALTGIEVLAASESTTCGLKDEDGSVWCWGVNEYGQLGNGTLVESAYATPVLGLPPAFEVAVGSSHACAVVGYGDVWCWGRNDSGQLGNGELAAHNTLPSSPPAPTQVVGLTDVTDIDAHGDNTCVTTDALAELWCWGDNSLGQVGAGLPQQLDDEPIVEFLAGPGTSPTSWSLGQAPPSVPPGGGTSGGGGASSGGATGIDSASGRSVPAEAAGDSARAQIHRIYLGLLDRVADEGGLTYWSARLRAGMATTAIVGAILESTEGRAIWGDLSGDALISQLYTQVLGRQPDPSGFAHWSAQVRDGRIDRARLATAFLQSSEFLERVRSWAS